jgi:hypothetical protein
MNQVIGECRGGWRTRLTDCTVARVRGGAILVVELGMRGVGHQRMRWDMAVPGDIWAAEKERSPGQINLQRRCSKVH